MPKVPSRFGPKFLHMQGMVDALAVCNKSKITVARASRLKCSMRSELKRQ